jgi:hypothetical protein
MQPVVRSNGAKLAVLPDLDVLRVAAPRTAAEMAEPVVRGALCLWDQPRPLAGVIILRGALG